jgi:hypothetical protein
MAGTARPIALLQWVNQCQLYLTCWQSLQQPQQEAMSESFCSALPCGKTRALAKGNEMTFGT